MHHIEAIVRALKGQASDEPRWRTIDEAFERFAQEDYDECIRFIEQLEPPVRLSAQAIALRIKARFFDLHHWKREGRCLSMDDGRVTQLGGELALFLDPMSEYAKSEEYSEIEHLRGHFLWTIQDDLRAAILYFDRLERADADRTGAWIRETLYFSAKTHNEGGSEEHKAIARDRCDALRRLNKEVRDIYADRRRRVEYVKQRAVALADDELRNAQ